MNNQLSRSIKSLAAIVATLLCYTTNSLQAYTLGNFTYSETATTIIITKCSQTAIGPIVIPAEITGKPVTHIKNLAFAGCDGLTSLTIPSSITVIGELAFAGCDSLTSLTIPSSVTSIGIGAFSSCDKLTAITADPANPKYSSVNGILFDKSKVTLLQCPGGFSGSYNIPTGVTSIGNRAFSGCSILTNVTIPSSVTSISPASFEFCNGLSSIIIPPNISEIPYGIFRGCTGLTSVTIPSSITTIGGDAFAGCTNLTMVTIPSSVTTIYGWAFTSCTSLKTALFLGNAPQGVGTTTFDNFSEGFKINYIAGKGGFNSPKWKGYPCFPATPDITVQRPLGTSLVDGITKKSFGTVLVGSTGRAKFFTVKNDGLAELTSLAISIDGANAGDFTLSALPRTSLLPGTATKFKVTFNPSATGTRTANLHIASNDADENPFDIELTGLGAP
jgi:hypothetical protein